MKISINNESADGFPLCSRLIKATVFIIMC